MKKITLTILTFFITLISYSQITLEKEVESEEYIHFFKLKDNSVKYYIFSNFEMKIYNSDHSIFKTISINKNDLGFSSEPSIFGNSIILVSQNVFDSDDDIEFLIFVGESDFNINKRKTFVIDDNGSILFEKEGQEPQRDDDHQDSNQNPFFIKNTDTGIKMILKDVDNENIKFIYKLPGTATLSSTKIELNNIELKAFPNPSSNFINLEYKLPNGINNGKILVYNLNGKKIKEYNVDNHVNFLKLNNNDLNTGVYFYSIIAGNYKSKPLKLIIQ